MKKNIKKLAHIHGTDITTKTLLQNSGGESGKSQKYENSISLRSRRLYWKPYG